MTKKLSQLLDIDYTNPEIIPEITQEEVKIIDDALTNLDKIESALPAVKGLDESDQELDDLTKMALDSFNELSDLGMQVDSRFASEIFSVASSMFGHALSAKTAKINKKMKTISLQLQKAELDRKLASGKKDEPEEPTDTGSATTLKFDRNQLLKDILDSKK